MSTRADSVRVAHPLFQAEGGGSTPTSALDLRFYRCDSKTFYRLNQEWHSRLPIVGNWQFGRAYYWALWQGRAFATAMWATPVCATLPQETMMELRRFAIAPDAPKNTASRMLAWMVKDVAKSFPLINMLIGYQDTEVHKGTIYKASGWAFGWLSKAHSWTHASRTRNDEQSKADKIAWVMKVKT